MFTSWGGYNDGQYKVNNEGGETNRFDFILPTLHNTMTDDTRKYWTHAVRCLYKSNCKCWKNFLIRVCQSLCKHWSSARDLPHRNNVYPCRWTPTLRNNVLPQSVVKTSLHFTSRNSFTCRCRGFTNSIPTLTFSRYTLAFFNHFFSSKSSLSLLPKFVGVFLCGSSLCSSLRGHCGMSLTPHFYSVPKPSRLC